MITSEKAYTLEQHRFQIYSLIWLLVFSHIIFHLPYLEFVIELYKFHLAVFTTLILSGVSFFWFRHQSRYLSFYALMNMEEWKHKSYEKYLFKRFWNKLTQDPYTPFLLALIVSIGYFLLVFLGVWNGLYREEETNPYGLIWQVHASILGLVFVTLSFLIGLLSADELNKKIDAGKRLANKLHFKRIITLNTLLSLWIGYTALSSSVVLWEESITIFALVFLVFSIIYLFRNFILFLFNQHLLRGLVLAELKSNLRKSLSAEIKSKVCDQLLGKISSEEQLYAGYDTPDSSSRPITGINKGRVIDVDLISLKRFAKKLEKQIPVKDFKTGVITNFKAVLLKNFSFHTFISDRKDLMALVSKEESKDTDALVQRIYKVNDSAPKEEISENLEDVVDMVIEYLKISPNKAFEIVEFIGDLIDESLEVMREYQIEFNYETSKQLTSFDWWSIGILEYRLDDIFKAIVRLGSGELITKALSFLDNRISSALEYKNYFVLHQFLRNYVRLYYLILHSENISSSVRKDITKNIHRKLQDLFKYRLKLDEDTIISPAELSFYSNVAVDIQNMARELIKAALDYEDIEGVKTFEKTLKTTSTTLNGYRNIMMLQNEVEAIKSDIQTNGTSPEKVEKIEYFTGLAELNEKLENRDQVTQFALGAWTIELYRRKEIDEKFMAEAMPVFQQRLNTLPLITRAFFETKKYEHRHDEINLSGWEMSRNEEAEVHSIRMDWLNYFYVLTALKHVPETLGADQFIYAEGMRENSSSHLESVLQGVESTIIDIEANRASWKAVSPDRPRISGGVEGVFNDLDKKDKLIELHKRGIKRRQDEESAFLGSSPIDDEVWKKFKEEFLEEYNKEKSLKKVIKDTGEYIDLTQEEVQDEEAFGVKTLDFKYHYIKDWFISTHGMAEHFADAMIRGENTRIAQELFKDIKSVSPIESGTDGLPHINEMIDKLRSDGYEPSVILIGGWMNLREMRATTDFVPEENQSGGLYGTYRNIRVYYARGNEVQDKVFVIDMKSLGKLYQKQVKGEPGKEIYLNVRTITDEDIKKWKEANAEIVKKDGVIMPDDEIKKYMGERVLLDILQKFELKLLDSNAGLYAKVPN